jgi:dipeptidase E
VARLLLLSNGQHRGLEPLEHAQREIDEILGADVRTVLFVPYALVSGEYDRYVEAVTPPFERAGRRVIGIHTVDDKAGAVRAADAIAVGGGNTWQLLRMLRADGVLPLIRDRVRAGAPYLGWSAGANLACPTIQTTNDMPIADPGGYDALGLIGWQINPHYIHGNPPGFEGEAREDRILEYLALHPDVIVTGMREGTLFAVDDAGVRYLGTDTVRVFRAGHEPVELEPGADVSFLPLPLS